MLTTTLLLLAPLASPASTASTLGPTLVPQDKIDFPEVDWHLKEAFGAPTVTKDAVYSGGFGLFRIDPKTGEVLSSTGVIEMGEKVPSAFAGSPAVDDKRVIATRTNGGVSAFDLDLGKEQWSWESKTKDYAMPGVQVDDTYYFARGSKVYALDVESGEERWSRGLSGGVTMTPAVADGLVYVGTSRGMFQALNAETGEPEWTVEDGNGAFGWSNPLADGGAVYCADRGIKGERKGALHAFDGKTGEVLWTSPFGATGFSKPFATKDEIFAGFGRYVARFDRKTGEIDQSTLVRTSPNAFGSPTVVGKRIYFGNLDGHLYAHRLKGGKLDWAFAVPDGQVLDFVHTGDNIYVSSTKGLFCLGAGKKGKGGSTLVWQGD